jgi:hypothetical protein
VLGRAAQNFFAGYSFRDRGQALPLVITPETLAERVCRTLDISVKDNSENLTKILRTALSETRDGAIGAAKAVCLEIAEDEAERCRGVGAQQTTDNCGATAGAAEDQRRKWQRPSWDGC